MKLSVNAVPIDEATIHAEMQYHPAASPEEAQYQAARALVVRELLLQQANQLGVDAALDAETRIARVMAREVQVPEADEASCERYYAHNREKFRTPDEHQVAHILITLDPNEPAIRARDQAQQRAAALIREIDGDPGRFADLASRHSACPSRSAGGDLGVVARGQTVPEFEEALDVLGEGEISCQPVQSRYGFHIIHLQKRLPGQQLPLSRVAARIRDYLEQQSRRRAVAQYLSLLIGSADIRGIELRGSDSPLVQ